MTLHHPVPRTPQDQEERTVIDPIRGTRHGTAPAPLSVLHNAMTGAGYTATDSLSR